eukprot:Seg419.4 transcript_id=Seg419.4/GoldUCD/mRNA.D3Y31 product="Exosome complex component RRP43" protein_id=Seg419.4/GoldUCD/D3Y31
MAADFKTAQPIEFYHRFLKEEVRPDGRALKDFRKTLLNIDSVSTAEGSALVKFGNTTVICGIKAELAEPTLDAANKGYIVPNVELPPLCSPKFRPGPPSEQAQVLSQFLLDTVQNSELIDLKKLCIVEKKIAWCLYADVICLNYDGNLQDASLTALLAALHNCRLPSVSYNEETGELTATEEVKTMLDIASNPVASTFAVFQDSYLIADPTDEEEALATGVVTVVTLEDGQLCSVNKPGGCAVSEDILRQCIERALDRGHEIRTIIDTLTATIDR